VRRRTALGAWLLAALLAWLAGYPLLVTLGEALAGEAGFTLEHVAAFEGGCGTELAAAGTARGPGAAVAAFGSAAACGELRALAGSLWISLASVALAALVGVPLAFVFERADFPGRRLIGALVALPVALPPLVGVVAFLFLYGESGFVPRALVALLGLSRPPWRLAGPGAILLVHAYSLYVYFYLFTRAGLARLDPALPEAAAALGAGRWRILWRVTLPLLRPALAGAALLTFMTSLASFSAPYLFGGTFRVMTTQIYASKQLGAVGLAQVESVALAALAVAGLALSRRLDRSGRLTGSVRGIAPRPRPLRSRSARALASAAGYALAGFLLLPHATLVLQSFVPPRSWTTEPFPPRLTLANYAALPGGPEGLGPVANSLWMAAAATAGALVLGFAAARGAIRRPGRLGRLLEALVALPWAVPGTVFALALATAMSAHAPWAGRFVLVGTVWLLPLAYLVRNLPLTGRAALAGLRQLDPALEEAAASLGAGPGRRLLAIVLPMTGPALAAGAGLAFITALGDFVTSIVLYTWDNRPISLAIYAVLRRDELGVAAVYGLLLMAASTAAFLGWGRGEESR
jgi:iron(III) transport system permease protein